MPTLPDKTALGGIPNPDPNRPIVRLPMDAGDPGAMAMDLLGSGIKGIAGTVKAKIKETDDYEVSKALVDFDLAQEKRLDEAKRTASPDAKDFTASYRGEYDQAARQFMSGMPDRVKPRLDEILVKRGAGFEKRAYDFELAERDRYHVDDLTTRLNDVYNDTTGTPDRRDSNSERGRALIRGSRLPERNKLKIEREFLDKNEEYAIRSLAERYVNEGRDVSEIVENLKKAPRGSWRKAEDDAPGRLDEGGAEDFRSQRSAPASVRFNNPGAMYPGPSAQRFGSVGTEAIGGGHKIAVFPDAVSGAAAQFDLLASSKYAGKTLGDAIRTWSGANSVPTYLKVIERETGMGRDTVLTPEMLRDPAVAIPLAKAMAVQEAGKGYPLSDAGWQRAHQMAFGGGADRGPATMDALAREADIMRRGKPLGQEPEGRVERTDLPPPDGAKDAGPRLPTKDGGEGETAKSSGATDPDEPYEADDVPFRHLAPATRRKLINVLRTAGRSQLTTQVSDDIERIKLGREPLRGQDGRTSLERAKGLLPDVQYRKIHEAWQEAEIDRRTIAPLRGMSVEDMHDHVAKVMREAEGNEESLRAARRVRDRAEREIEKIGRLRESDPVRSVRGFVGEEGDERRPSLPNTAAAMAMITQSRARQVATVAGPDGQPQMREIGPAQKKLTRVQEREIMADAVLKDQETIFADEPWRARIITRTEAKDLLRMPKDGKMPDGKVMDREQYRRLINEAASRAEREYGPKYAQRALREAIGFQLHGVDGEHKDLQSRIIEKMARGEAITAAEIGQVRDLERLNQSGLRFGADALVGVDRIGRAPSGSPMAPMGNPMRPMIGQVPMPNTAQAQWLRDNPAGWQSFDEKFGDGASARVLGGEAPVVGRTKTPAAKPGSREDQAATAVKPKDKGWFGR